MLAFKNISETFLLYTCVKADPIVALVRRMAALLSQEGREEEARHLYYEYAALLLVQAEAHGFAGNLFHCHLCRLFLTDMNPFSMACERGGLNESSTLYQLARQDMCALRDMLLFDVGIFSRHIGQNENLMAYVPNNASGNTYMSELGTLKDGDALAEAFKRHYAAMGAGVLSGYAMLRFEAGGLAGAAYADTARLDDIVGYAEQKRMLCDNTEAFLRDFPANNVLLVGARGTGKSSCVKALANEYFAKGLRVVELPKDKLEELPDVLAALGARGKKFLLYIDDLSFDESERQYKYLKSILEGGVVQRPNNVLFYATSNRRHIVQEKWSDKQAGYEDEELHATDTRNEKMSLSDRFGLTITFPKPSPQEYFAIVSELARREGLDVSAEFLQKQAAMWELNQKGLSGRTARQFLDHMICEINKV